MKLAGRGARLLVAAGVLAAAGAGWRALPGPTRAGDWAAVVRDDLVLSVEVTGTLKAIDSALLGPPLLPDVWEFKIAQMAPEGAEVKKGRPVLGFDTTEVDRMLQEKLAEADEAATEIEKRTTDLEIQRKDGEMQVAEVEARRRKAALKLDVPAELTKATDLAKARLDLALAEREIVLRGELLAAAARSAASELGALADKRDRANGRVKELRDALERMQVKAPRDGTVIYVATRRGEKKKVGDSCWRADRLMDIPDLGRMRAEGEVDEAEAGKVAVGQRVTLRLDTLPDVEFAGRIEAIHGSVERPSPDSPVKVIKVDVTLERTDTGKMRPGMRFRGKVEVGRVPGVVVVPADAVFATLTGPVAYRRSWLGFEPRSLRLGRRNLDVVEVIEGLRPGDRVSRRDRAAPGQGDT